jgi:hypothetical protein
MDVLVTSISLVIAEWSPPVGVLRLVMCATGCADAIVVHREVATADWLVQADAVSAVVSVRLDGLL